MSKISGRNFFLLSFLSSSFPPSFLPPSDKHRTNVDEGERERRASGKKEFNKSQLEREKIS